MKIKLARTLGYCPGVRRAMDMTFGLLAQRSGEVYSHGILIHNQPAMELLFQKGLRLWQGENKGTVIVRAHGLPPDELAVLYALDVTVSDATCPWVHLVQRLVAEQAALKKMVIIWGQANHPEVIGLMGYAGTAGRVVATAEEVADLPTAEEVVLLSQTTQNLAKWPEISAAVRDRWPNALLKNTICEAIKLRQKEVLRLAKEADALVIIGGKTSGNTASLAYVGHRTGLITHLVETIADLSPDDFKEVKTVAVAAGASTSSWQIAQILQTLRTLARSQEKLSDFWSRFLRALILSSVIAALGLASLAVCASLLMGLKPPLLFFSFFFFQILALYLGRDIFQSRNQALRLADPDRIAFFAKYHNYLVLFTLTSAFTALAVALMTSLALIIISLGGWLILTVHQFTPRPKQPALSRALAKPGLLALSWALAIIWAAQPPTTTSYSFSFPSNLNSATLGASGVVWAQIFILAILTEVLGVQGDRIFGRPTLSTILGEVTLKRFLNTFLAIWAGGLTIGWALGALPSLALWLIFNGPLYNYFLLKLIFSKPERRKLNPILDGFLFEALIFSQLLLTGLTALLWAQY